MVCKAVNNNERHNEKKAQSCKSDVMQIQTTDLFKRQDVTMLSMWGREQGWRGACPSEGTERGQTKWGPWQDGVGALYHVPLKRTSLCMVHSH